MLTLVSQVALAALLAMLIFSDWKHRTVNVLQLMALGFISVILSGIALEPMELLKRVGINLGWMLSQLVLVQLYFAFKERQFRSIIDDKIGLGDLVFFAAITPLFDPYTFILFYLSSLLFALLAFGAMRKWLSEHQSATIPLVGTCAVWLTVFYASVSFFELEPLQLLSYAN